MEAWKEAQRAVTQQMLAHTRPFVTALGSPTQSTVRLVGTGSYIQVEEHRLLVTCEHVARIQPMHYRFWGSKDVFEHTGPWCLERHPFDAACARLSDKGWEACEYSADAVPYGRFAKKHQIIEQAELLFFRGFSGENADYGFGIHQTNGTGYCSQEKAFSGDRQLFELFWEPQRTEIAADVSEKAEVEIKYEDAHGFSGSLVWNTRYLETRNKGREWSPKDAVITGLLRRWAPDTRTLLVWRVEHFRAWLEGTSRSEEPAQA